MSIVDVLLSRLPRRLSRWWPSSRRALSVKDITEEGDLLPARGQRRAVLRLPVEPFAGGASVADLTRLAAAVNAGAGRATLIAWGKPHTLARQTEERQHRAARLTGGRREMALSQASHLTAMSQGRPATPDRPAIPPVRRHGFYLVVEAPTAGELRTLADNLCGLYRAVRVGGHEAASVEADIWRGMPLPPSAQFWQDAADEPDVEFYMGPDGASVRRVNPETGAKVEQLYP